jgi:hypothetical protein
LYVSLGLQMAADKVKEDVELDEMEDEEEVGEKGANSKRSLPGSLNAYQNFLEMMQVSGPFAHCTCRN